MKIIKIIKTANDFIRILRPEMGIADNATFTNEGLTAIFNRITEEKQILHDGERRNDYELSFWHLKDYFGEGLYQDVLDRLGAGSYEKLADYTNWSKIIKGVNGRGDRIVYHIKPKELNNEG